MILRQINLQAESVDAASTELMFEIAGARADGCDLVRVDLENKFDKLCSGVVKILKGMKQKGLIQFFATEESFDEGSTEASFLANKYNDLLNTEREEGTIFIYIKM